MLAKVRSGAVVGLDGAVVEVEVDISSGLPAFTIVGLPDAAVQESRERVRAAIRNSGCTFPMKRIVVNLAPADLKKAGPAYDLPIAVGILLGSEQASTDLSQAVFLGELSLDGSLRHTTGVLPMVAATHDKGFSDIIVPTADAREASLVDGARIMPFDTLSQLVSYFQGEIAAPEYQAEVVNEYIVPLWAITDLAHVKGQEHVKRALEIAAGGGHNVIMMGPPGAGKTLLARSLPSILPPMTNEEALEVTKVYSISGLLPPDSPFIRQRPFRSPHHTISDAGLIGGGQIPKPGEVSLSHNGVLFLDELPEFKKNVLEVMRQPLEEGRVTISRALSSLTFPSSFMLIAAMNPCPCGFYTDANRECTCTMPQILRYRSKISGPLMDRIDIHVEVPAVKYRDLTGETSGEDSETIKARVNRAREVQRERFSGKKIYSNAQMTSRHLKKFCQIGENSKKLLEQAIDKLGLSARAYTRILKIARTIADLEQVEDIAAQHISEAIQYRSLDRTLL